MITIKSATKEYKVNVENDYSTISELLNISNSFWVIDRNVYNLYKDLFAGVPADSLYLLDAVEENKTVETALSICERMTEMSSKRNTTLISVGGGITQDVTGFVASVLYRGIKWVFIPTTLLASCDSCIGGKTSLNYKSFKNLLGTFYPPDEIHIYPSMFKTLTEKDFLSCMGEVVKFNIMAGKDDIDTIKNDMPELLNRSDTLLNSYVFKSLLFKKDFIEIDEFDRGERIKLNYAHTFGHAFETLSKYAIPHGTAVAIGMIVANRISLERGWLTPKLVEDMESILKQIIKVDFAGILDDGDVFINAIKKDKKQIDDSITAVLMHDDMSLELVHDVTKEEVLGAVKVVRGLL